LVLFGVLFGYYSIKIHHKIIDILVQKKKNLFFKIFNNIYLVTINMIFMLLAKRFLLQVDIFSNVCTQNNLHVLAVVALVVDFC
jgi:hypothetical protein